MRRLSVFEQITCLLTVAFGLLILCCVIVSQVAFWNWEQTRQSNAHSAVEKTVEQINTRLDVVETYIRETAVISQSLGFLTYEENFDPILSRKHLHNHLSAMTSVCPDLDVLFVSTAAEGLYLSRYNQGLRIADRIVFTDILKTETFPESKQWQLLAVEGTCYLTQTYTYGEYTSGAAVELSNIQSALVYSDESSFYSVLDQQGNVCFSTQEEDFLSGKVFVVESPIGTTGLTIRYTVDRVGGFAMNGMSGVLPALLLVLCGATVICALIIMRKGVKGPIDNLLNLTDRIISGDYKSRIATGKVSPEFAALDAAVNNMLDELEGLRIQQYEREIELRSQELKLLRSQIRPHFYLNAMSMINNMTYQNRNEDIRTYLKCLSEHLRYAFSINKQFVTLEEELTVTQNYIQMQSIRYPESVTYTMEAAPETLQTQVMHYMLITLIENCFRHGLDVYSSMSITLTCKRECHNGTEICLIRLSDNGPGFSEQAIADFYDEGEASGDVVDSKVGLLNIKHTLNLQFGEKAQMDIGNGAGGGAVVTICIPIQEEKHENTDRG